MRRSKFFWFGGVVVFSLVLLLGYIWYVRSRVDNWTPTTPEPPAKTIFEAKWGDGESELGFYKASGKEGDVLNDGFQNFYVTAGRVYIADSIKKQISVFEKSKFVRSYQYPIAIDEGLVVKDNFIYVLDGRGYVSKIDIKSGDYKASRLVIKENEYGYISHNGYIMYLLNNILVINDRYYMNKCLSLEDLSSVSCPFAPKDSRTEFSSLIYLSDNYYAKEINYHVWLHNLRGRKVGVVKGLPWDSLLYTVTSGIQVTIDGVCYVEHSENGAKIYFKRWQR